jgi:hypothetical protein
MGEEAFLGSRSRWHDQQAMGDRMEVRSIVSVILALLFVACTGATAPTKSPTTDRSSRPVPSSVVSKLRLKATVTPEGSPGAVSEAAAEATARAWLVQIHAWRPAARVRASLARLTDMGLHDGLARLVYVSGVAMHGMMRPERLRHVLVVIDATTGKRRGQYSY